MRRGWILLNLASVMLAACAGLATETSGAGGDEAPQPLRFDLRPSYSVGERVRVRIENLDDRAYIYNERYEACDMTFLEVTGREFLIPPGTHCDLVVMREIGPGETAELFTWDLSECTKDEWGCVKSRPLPPGTYTIRASFEPAGGGQPVAVEGSFEIREG